MVFAGLMIDLAHSMLYRKANRTERRNTMRKEMIQVKTRKEAEQAAPWASKVVKVDGGYMAFESIDDYRAWKNQQ
jgi:hypothetical protein